MAELQEGNHPGSTARLGFHGTREAFAAALLEMAKSNDKIVFVSPDSLKAMRAVPFAEQYPLRYVEVGISEQSAVDVAAGLASTGLIPFVATYGGFLTLRAGEQMRTFVAYPNLNVKFVGVNGGLIGGEREGVTHQFYEDIGMTAMLPTFTIFTPADGNQTYQAVKLAAETSGPVYIRAGSGREPEVFNQAVPFSREGFTLFRNDGGDALLLSSGFLLDRVIEAGKRLKEKGVRCAVADVNILYSKNPEALVKLLSKYDRILTVEDHNINGGLGAWICALVCENRPAKVKRLGLRSFGESGPAKDLADHYGFSAESITRSVQEFIQR
jgi:transketolase